MRFISIPFLNNNSVGILRILHCSDKEGTASVFSLAKRKFGSRRAAAASNTGAKLWHGPHHEAQQSTITGMSLPDSVASTLSAVNSTGLPINKNSLQRPHLGLSLKRSA